MSNLTGLIKNFLLTVGRFFFGACTNIYRGSIFPTYKIFTAMHHEEKRYRRDVPAGKLSCGEPSPKRTPTPNWNTYESDASTESKRLVKRARRDMDEEGPSGSGMVLPQHPQQYQEDEEESEGETYHLNCEEESVEGGTRTTTCYRCERIYTRPYPQGNIYFCSNFCYKRTNDAEEQQRDSNYDTYIQRIRTTCTWVNPGYTEE